MPDVMALAQPDAAAGEAAAAVAVVQRETQRGWNRARARADLHNAAGSTMSHDHPDRIAGQAARRFRGNACAAVEDGLAGSVPAGQRRRIDVDDDLVAL